MKKRTTRLLALFLALLLMVSGCTPPVKLTNGRNPFRSETPSATAPSGSQNESQPPSADAQKTQDQFSKLCKELFEDEVTPDMITLTLFPGVSGKLRNHRLRCGSSCVKSGGRGRCDQRRG